MYMNPMATKNQKPTVNTQKLKRKSTSLLLKKIIKPQQKKQKAEEMD